jgi:hypothetical protein
VRIVVPGGDILAGRRAESTHYDGTGRIRGQDRLLARLQGNAMSSGTSESS